MHLHILKLGQVKAKGTKTITQQCGNIPFKATRTCRTNFSENFVFNCGKQSLAVYSVTWPHHSSSEKQDV